MIIIIIKQEVNNMKRYKMSKGSSKRKFSKGAKTNRMNTKPRPMRGGTRL